jgi:fatty-acyl-CoA synthase
MSDIVPDLLAQRAALSPERIALETPDGRALNYAALHDRAGRTASMLAARGVGEGDRVAILCRGRPAFFELLFACARIGAILVPLNWRMPPAELDGLVADAAPALLCHDGALRDLAEALAAPPPRLDLDADYEPALAAAPAAPAPSLWPAQRIWYLLYTSGTTGRPKGVIYTPLMALANLVNIGTATGLRAGDTVAAFLPLFHTAGINLHALPALLAGGRVIILPEYDGDAVAGLLAARRLDLFFAVPTVYADLLARPDFAGLPLGHVRHWGSGGAPLPERVARACRDLGIRLCNGMGMTETGPTALLQSPDEAWERIGAAGRPQLLCAARIAAPDGRLLPDGAEGELQFAGPGVTPGYWRDAAATAAAFTADGWLRSGDLARRDPDGGFTIVGRLKDMFISGGENVYAGEVERVLASHPAIAGAAVLGVADERWGEVGRAFVEPAPGAGALSPAALTAYCRERLAPYKVPASFMFVDALPRTAAGKVRKHLLR